MRLRVLLLTLPVLAVAVGLLADGLGDPQSTWLGPAVVSGPSAAGSKEIALTFDDGPSEPYTAQVLDVLKRERVRATFFLCGKSAERYPELVRRIRDEGHVIGNHTWSHPYLHLTSRARIADELDRTQDALERISGRRPRLFRPPFGVRWFPLWGLLRERGLTMVLWTARGYDGRLPAAEIVQTTMAQLKPGAIVLLHDGFEAREPAEVDRSNTVRALPELIRRARAEGYDFVTVPEAAPELSAPSWARRSLARR